MAKILFSLVLLCIFYSSQSNAFIGEEKEPFLCLDFYSEIDRVYFSYSANIPDVDKDIFDAALDRVISHYSNILSKENIEVTKRENNKEPLEENELEFELYHSYSPKESFSLPLEKDVLAFWYNKKNSDEASNAIWGLNIESYLKKEDKDSLIRYLNSDFFSNAIQSELCLVVLHSRGKACPQHGKLPTREFKEVTEKCVLPNDYSPELKEAGKFIKSVGE